MIAPIGLKKTLSRLSGKIFREKIMVQMALTSSSRTSLLRFWFLPDFVFVFIIIRLVVMSNRSTMHDKQPFTPMEESLSVFFTSVESY